MIKQVSFCGHVEYAKGKNGKVITTGLRPSSTKEDIARIQNLSNLKSSDIKNYTIDDSDHLIVARTNSDRAIILDGNGRHAGLASKRKQTNTSRYTFFRVNDADNQVAKAIQDAYAYLKTIIKQPKKI